MKIINLTAENVKRLVAVSITPKGNMVEITGKNRHGKTSVLDSIYWAFTGTSNIQAEPIRKGQDKAMIKVTLGDKEVELIVTRTFARKADGGHTTSVHVESADGARFPKPQTMLDDLLGAIAMDPLEFARAPAEKQFDTMAAFVKGYDFAKMAGLNKADYDKRTDLNRQAKQAQAAADMIKVPEEVLDMVDDTAIADELQEVAGFNAGIDQQQRQRQQQTEDIAEKRAVAAGNRQQIERLKETIKELQGEAALLDVEASKLERSLAEAKPIAERKDPAAIRARLDAARATNQRAEREAALRTTRDSHLQLAAAAKKAADALTEAMEAREAAKQKAIAAAQMPIKGIEFGDGHIRLNGVPFDQASDAERLRTSMAIAMAANPGLRVIRVRDGSLLDEDAMKIISEMVGDADYQCWIERVDSSGKIGFVIEDGSVKAEPEEKGALL